PAYVVVRRELTGLQDHLQVHTSAGLFDGDDLVEDGAVAAGEEGAAVDHHVDLVGAGGDRVLGVGDLDVQAGPTGREAGGDAGHLDAAVAEPLLRGRHQVRVDTDRRYGGTVRIGRVGAHRLRG